MKVILRKRSRKRAKVRRKLYICTITSSCTRKGVPIGKYFCSFFRAVKWKEYLLCWCTPLFLIIMPIHIKKVTTKDELKQFIRFNYELYKNNAYSVPDLLEDMLDTFNPEKNAAYDFCEAELFLAEREGIIVGRVACLVNHKANATWQTKNARFGWIDFVDDLEVSGALLRHAEEWGKQHGCDKIIGPMGFTDLDAEGMLIEGFDKLSTMATIYNFPYYPFHLEHWDYEREIDWVERKIYVPVKGHEAEQERYFKVARRMGERLNLKVRKFKSVKELKTGGYVYKIFDVVNRAYAPLFGFSELTRKQVDKYADEYLKLLDLRLLTVIEDANGEPVAMGVCIPSLAVALQKAKGKLFPFGWWHLLKALKVKRSKIVELLLVAVLPEYQNKGVNALLFADIIPIAKEMGFEYAESNPQLETNHQSQDQWKGLDNVVHKRRRCFQKSLV